MLRLWQKTRQWSLEGFYQVYDLLGEHFDRIYFESEVEETGKTFVADMIRNGHATDGRPDNPVFINLDERLGHHRKNIGWQLFYGRMALRCMPPRNFPWQC